MRRFKQFGISLLEVLLSLTIIAIILVMATRYFFIANNNDRINTIRQQIGSVIAGVNGWKGQNHKYSTDQNFLSILYNRGFLARSTSLRITGSIPSANVKLYDPWGATINVTSNGSGVQIAVKLPKQSDCISILNSYPAGHCDSQGNFSMSFV